MITDTGTPAHSPACSSRSSPPSPCSSSRARTRRRDRRSRRACHGRPTRTIAFATGELRLYRTRQYVCAVTVAQRPGPRRQMAVSLQPRGGRAVVKSGRSDRQAGPVTVHALNRCVRAAGSVAGRGTVTGWILC
ncbi:hypothetical protein O1L60_13430 [Streptomyces diastatochromogenes]|nr:hypothetical protein [Streptomyces diastatochromogenes]